MFLQRKKKMFKNKNSGDLVRKKFFNKASILNLQHKFHFLGVEGAMYVYTYICSFHFRSIILLIRLVR
jgi:hypothetical protein